ncbi:hypothetical protein [Maribacter sp. 2-571]|uniref:hypothetical protein n=1 Tax=Maribacter sp. 2-571 TaxID=3417569 RepID=UPI003D32E516
MKYSSEDLRLFRVLLEEVALKFRERYKPGSPKIQDWKGQDIVDFQEDLRSSQQSSISEKWFYNYVKHTPEKLPRVDILNLLSRYIGNQNWNDFKVGHAEKETTGGGKIPVKTIVLVGCLVTVLGMLGYALIPKTRTVHFCFLDADKKEPITTIPIDLIVLDKGQSPSYYKTDSLGCFHWETEETFVRFIAKSPYHKTDTIYKTVSNDTSHEIRLRTDDYALMLRYYSGNNVKDWKARRSELDRLIADKALIFELLPYQIGVELYSKERFINKLSMPTESLKRLEVVETVYKNGQIVKLKFKSTNE